MRRAVCESAYVREGLSPNCWPYNRRRVSFTHVAGCMRRVQPTTVQATARFGTPRTLTVAVRSLCPPSHSRMQGAFGQACRLLVVRFCITGSSVVMPVPINTAPPSGDWLVGSPQAANVWQVRSSMSTQPKRAQGSMCEFKWSTLRPNRQGTRHRRRFTLLCHVRYMQPDSEKRAHATFIKLDTRTPVTGLNGPWGPPIW